MARLLKKGDKVTMRDYTPEFKNQGFTEDGVKRIGVITSTKNCHGYEYTVNWEEGASGLLYNDIHIELYDPNLTPKIINNYEIY